MNKKILLMYITYGSGHHSATLAIEQAIHTLYPNMDVLNIDGFGYTYPIIEKITHAIYMGVIDKLPGIWDFLYDNQNFAKKINRIKESIHRKSRFKIKELIESQNCKVVICSQAFPCGMVADYKRYCSTDIKLIAVITDFMPHSYWIYEEIDFYIIGSKEAKETLLKKGVKEEKIKFFGIPIDPKFSEKLDKKMAANELNIPLDRPVVLIMGGGRGLGPIKKLVNVLGKSNINAHFLVVAGLNKSLFNYLKNSKHEHKIFVYGYIDYVDKLMTVADILITKPGGVTTAEALAKCLPMLIIRPLPGQEQNNTNFLLKHGIVERADSVEDALRKIIFLLDNNKKLNFLREKISKISKPFSSSLIAELAVSLC